MILITDVKYLNVPSDPYETWDDLCKNYTIRAMNYPDNYDNYVDALSEKDLNIETEIVKGKRFVNNSGDELCIGMKKDVQKLIGLPFSVYDDLRKESDELFIKNSELMEKNHQLKMTILDSQILEECNNKYGLIPLDARYLGDIVINNVNFSRKLRVAKLLLDLKLEDL